MNTSDADQNMITAIQNGNRDAFAELYDQHNAWLFAVAYRILQNHSDAEDLLHDVFIEIWKKAASYKAERGTVRSWLAVKIRSRALDRLRALKRVRKHIIDQAYLDIEPVSKSTETEITNHILAKRLLEKLSLAQRNIIELSYFQGFTCHEIANHCQMPLGTVKSGLQRSIQVLRRELNSQKESAYAHR